MAGSGGGDASNEESMKHHNELELSTEGIPKDEAVSQDINPEVSTEETLKEETVSQELAHQSMFPFVSEFGAPGSLSKGCARRSIFPIMKLPFEVREMVYGYAIPRTVKFKNTYVWVYGTNARILLVSKAMRHEVCLLCSMFQISELQSANLLNQKG